ncbi:DUF58 domain-containing protein [Cellulomonas sp. URHD0024]|uniref:DUF58 domain-containing protein n=1 Tax=Cellulomonas sp. URHD0024 TaxID=1302620 RepID=UPI00040BAC58|nr:DUF58 domain-containing protein [Cellulomonas sp. URHD0024]
MDWVRSNTAFVGVCVGAALVVAGAFAGRPDVAVLGAAPVVAGFRDWRRRPTQGPAVHLRASDLPQTAGTLRADIAIRTEGVAALVGVRRGPRALFDARRGPRALVEVLVAVDGSRTVPVVVHTVRTGPQQVAEVEVQGVGPGAASVSEATEPASRNALVLPSTRPLSELPLPPRLRGLTGAHESRRPGEGGGLRDVHPYAPGDRLRRIDWRVTARRAPDLHELYVRREHALAEAVVMLVVDSRDEVGPDPTTWRGSKAPRPQDPTSLDLARQAAASVAEGFLDQGDRVGLEDLGIVRRPLPPGGGRRQLSRIRHALAVTHPEGEPPLRVRPPQLPSGALVLLFSTFLDDGAALVASTWRRAGHRVVAVDVLPVVREGHLTDREHLALRLLRIAREDRLAVLADQDVELVTWRDAPSVALAGLARRTQRRAGAAR